MAKLPDAVLIRTGPPLDGQKDAWAHRTASIRIHFSDGVSRLLTVSGKPNNGESVEMLERRLRVELSSRVSIAMVTGDWGEEYPNG